MAWYASAILKTTWGHEPIVPQHPRGWPGVWRDNVFVVRLRKSVKYEEVYLRAYNMVSGAKARLARYLHVSNRVELLKRVEPAPNITALP